MSDTKLTTASLDVLSTDREREILRDLNELISQRAAAETEIEQRFRSGTQGADRSYEESKEEIETRYTSDTARTETDYASEKEQEREQYGTDLAQTKKRHETDRFQINEKADHDESATKKAYQEANWATETVYETKQGQPRAAYDMYVKGVLLKRQALRGMEGQAAELLRQYRQRRLVLEPVAFPTDPEKTPAETGGGNPAADLKAHSDTTRDLLVGMRGFLLARQFEGMRPYTYVFLVMVAAAALTGYLLEWALDERLAYGAGVGGVVMIGVLFGLHAAARSRLRGDYDKMRTGIAEAYVAAEACREIARQKRKRDEAELIAQRDADIQTAKERFEPTLQKVAQIRKRILAEIKAESAAAIKGIEERHARESQAVEDRYVKRKAEIEERHALDQSRVGDTFDSATSQSRAQHGTEWESLESNWKDGMARLRESLGEIGEHNHRLFPAWDDSGAWNAWSPPSGPSHAIRFGELSIDLAEIPDGLPLDERLQDDGPTRFMLPALFDFPRRCSLLLEATDEGRDHALDVLQATMLRVLTSLPPGKVRFIIIDPVGLGRNFAGFMHLADYDESFVSSRIWTETRHIEQRLTDITEHMENVIQKYLRNEFESITDYNAQAGEIAEPFRFLVIADFPANFNESAARRLASIVESGPRCGVFTLVSMDARQNLPQGFQMADLRSHSTNLVWEGGRFIWNDPVFRNLPLHLDPAPDPDFLTDTLHVIGRQAKDATRVEVPFEVIVPEPGNYWTRESTKDLVIPLGQCGATKLQNLMLGHGTAQHVLLAGKTGSGKSTLLHVLITSMALLYGPDQVELYLVDFKKGVEFKTYATHKLPHARAVAIESDREFGLSVLQKLDDELKQRGNLFRDHGVQDLAGYKRVTDNAVMPRILLVIDEFQEFFTEDDRLSQDASLLLDRLVRQGRAFGIHVLLGSQTISGAYSLARSTISQMAIRIALQCSETDAHLIMSDDNSAARLLSRPGEAIYNDQSGLIEGNSPFQIVWLPDLKREGYLKAVRELAEARGFTPPERQIVFEGNVPADIDRNLLLERAIEAGESESTPLAARAWLGEAIAIKDPTAADFRRQSGSNLVIVGQRHESAMAMLATSMVSLAVAHDTDAKFYILDGTPADAPDAGYLGRVAEFIPHDSRVVGWREIGEAMNEIGNEVARRRDANITDAPGIYVLIHGIQRFRELRRAADDFGFGLADSDAPPAPDKQFNTILQEGPSLGVHTLLWCDTVNNLNRALDRQGLREFDMRVLFQMNAADSSNILDSPAAEKLGARRALFYSEETGAAEKFRPYAPPPLEWLDSLRSALTNRKA